MPALAKHLQLLFPIECDTSLYKSNKGTILIYHCGPRLTVQSIVQSLRNWFRIYEPIVRNSSIVKAVLCSTLAWLTS